VKRLVAEKTDPENEVKVVCLDTVDQLVDMAIQYTIMVSNNASQKKVTSINEAMGGFARGTDYVRKIIIAQLTHLENSGYGMVFIGHTKEKEKEDSETSIKYDLLTGNMQDKFDDIFTNIADVWAVIMNKRTIKDIEVKNNEKQGTLAATERRWIFRSPTGSVNCGSRFANMPDSSEFTPEAYIDALTNAILSEGEYSVEEMKEKRNAEIAEREKQSNEYVESAPIIDTDGDKVDNLEYYRKASVDICRELDSKYRNELSAIITATGVSKVSLIADLETAKLVYTKLEEFRKSVK
jgi:hypothetical protein